MKKTLSTLLTLSLVACAQQQPKQEKPEGFVYIKDVIPSITIEPRYLGTNNFIGSPIDGYESDNYILTIEAAEALKDVQADLKTDGLGLKVYDAYRPQKAVDHFVRWAKDLEDTKMKDQYYPDVDKSKLFEKGYIAAKSGHSRGSTVDLTLIQLGDNSELDMGTLYDLFGPESHPDYKELEPKQWFNRKYLQDVMEKHGFKHLPEEWWHFTLKDEPYPNTYFDFDIE